MPQSVLPLRSHSTRPRIALLTGVTGFVGQALLERFVREEAHLHVVIRGSGTASAEERLDDLLTRAAFDPWRAEVGPAGVARARGRIHIIEADLTAGLPPLPADLDLVVHSASSVSFDDPWDAALHANVLGPTHLYEALAAAGADPHVVHLSTSYVGTDRHTLAPEARVDHDIDWRAEIEAADTLRRDSEHDLSSGSADARLRVAGRERAHGLGWTDVYTMTKSLGERAAEQLWAETGHRLTILRPTIIESALARPYPGWIDGFKVADPLIAAFAKGRLVAFPGHPDAVIDIVPVDVVVDAALAASHLPHDEAQPRYLQVGTGRSNPMTLAAFSEYVEGYITENPWTDRAGNVIRPRPWRFLDPDDLDSWAARRENALRHVSGLLRLAPTSMLNSTRRRVATAARGLSLMRTYVGIYQPYSCSRTVYDDANTRALLARAAAADPALAGTLDVTQIDWAGYIRDVHMPSLTRLAEDHRRAGSRPLPDSAPARAGRRGRMPQAALAAGA